MGSWHSTLDRERTLVVVADSRTPELISSLNLMHSDWEKPFELWLTQANEAVASWAATLGIKILCLDGHPTISLPVPCLAEPLILSAAVLQPAQLVFLAQGAISSEGILLGGMYSLSYLVPRNNQPCLTSQWCLLLMELYRRFQGVPAILPSRNGSSLQLICGDPWALDEALLATLPLQSGAFHTSLRRLLLAPSECSLDWTRAVPAGLFDIAAYRSSPWHRFCTRAWELPLNRVGLVVDKIKMIVIFRARKYWRTVRGV